MMIIERCSGWLLGCVTGTHINVCLDSGLGVAMLLRVVVLCSCCGVWGSWGWLLGAVVFGVVNE